MCARTETSMDLSRPHNPPCASAWPWQSPSACSPHCTRSTVPARQAELLASVLPRGRGVAAYPASHVRRDRPGRLHRAIDRTYRGTWRRLPWEREGCITRLIPSSASRPPATSPTCLPRATQLRARRLSRLDGRPLDASLSWHAGWTRIAWRLRQRDGHRASSHPLRLTRRSTVDPNRAPPIAPASTHPLPIPTPHPLIRVRLLSTGVSLFLMAALPAVRRVWPGREREAADAPDAAATTPSPVPHCRRTRPRPGARRPLNLRGNEARSTGFSLSPDHSSEP